MDDNSDTSEIIIKENKNYSEESLESEPKMTATLYIQHIQLNIPAKTTAATLYVQHIQLNIPAKTTAAVPTKHFLSFIFFLVFVIIFYDLIMSGGFKINKITRSMTLCILFIFFLTFVNILQH